MCSRWGCQWQDSCHNLVYNRFPHLFDNLLLLAAVIVCSRWGCQWQDSCHEVNGTNACAPILHSYGLAAAAIWQSDPDVPIFINGG